MHGNPCSVKMMGSSAPVAIPRREAVPGVAPLGSLPVLHCPGRRWNPITAALAQADDEGDDAFYVGRPQEIMAEEGSWAVSMQRRRLEGQLGWREVEWMEEEEYDDDEVTEHGMRIVGAKAQYGREDVVGRSDSDVEEGEGSQGDEEDKEDGALAIRIGKLDLLQVPSSLAKPKEEKEAPSSEVTSLGSQGAPFSD